MNPIAAMAPLWENFDATFKRAMHLWTTDQNALFGMVLTIAEQQKQSAGPAQEFLQFQQFIISAVAVHESYIAGELSQMGDWIQWGLTDSPTNSFIHEMHIGRITIFWSNPIIRLWPGFIPIFVRYYNSLYDYARRRTAIKNICEELWKSANHLFLEVMRHPPNYIHPPEISLGGNMLCWAAKESPELAKEFSSEIEKQVARQDLSKQQRALFCTYLSTRAGNFTKQGALFWINKALSEFENELSGVTLAQMQVSAYTVENGHDAALVLKQMKLTQETSAARPSTVAFARYAAQTAEFVSPFFVKCAAIPDASLVLEGLQTWYQQLWPDAPIDANDLLIQIPFGETATTVIDSGKLQILSRDTQSALEKLSREMNEFLGVYATVAYADNSNIKVPDQPGKPQIRQKGLPEALQEAYCPEGISISDAPKSQLILPMEGHPIQATQLMCWGRTWPIASSLGSAQPDRKVQSVLIWCGGTFTEAMEAEMVKVAFTKAGATVLIISPETSTAEAFLKEYQNKLYDVIWVISHGEFDHWSPHKVKLHLARDYSSMDLEDLWNRAPNLKDERRLLVLNICDGARFAEPGMLPRVGLAPGLASPYQATISHLWPVQIYPPAAFGAYLAHFIASGYTFFDAYSNTLLSLRKTADEVGTDLAKLYGRDFELTERLQQQSDDFNAIETWGSAAFFQ